MHDSFTDIDEWTDNVAYDGQPPVMPIDSDDEKEEDQHTDSSVDESNPTDHSPSVHWHMQSDQNPYESDEEHNQ